MGTNLANAYKKYNNGDPLSDEEIQAGEEHFKRLTELLVISGPVFHLAFCESNRMFLRFREIREAREREYTRKERS